MDITVDYFEEPQLQFGDYFEYEDAKTGLAEFGPFGKNVPGLHVSEIKLGFIGTRESISEAQSWIDRCSKKVESENVKVDRQRGTQEDFGLFDDDSDEREVVSRRIDKTQNRDFIGFNADSTFKSTFRMNPRWDREINQRELDSVLSTESEEQRILELANLVEAELSSICQTDPVPDVVILSLTSEIEEAAYSTQVSGNFHLNLRRELKARAMRQETPIPLQLIRPRTIHGGTDTQGPAKRAWNFCTALYYKAGGTPWRPLSLEEDTCYMGISFYIAQELDDALTMRSSVSMAFDYLGQGLVLRGDKFQWNHKEHGQAAHMTTEATAKLIRETLNEYVRMQGNPPKRVVIHKTSRFWGSEHENYNEVEGISEGVDSVFPRCDIDLVTLKSGNIRLFREGDYPPLRGTYFTVNNAQHFLYTMGFIPHLETYPKPYVPKPWKIDQHIGGSSPKDLLEEVLTLTKMNVNNCSFADGKPITIMFAEKIGEVMKHVGRNGVIQSKYRFYM